MFCLRKKSGQPVLQGAAQWNPACSPSGLDIENRLGSDESGELSDPHVQLWEVTLGAAHSAGATWQVVGPSQAKVLLPNSCKCFGNFICKHFVFWSGSEWEGGRTAACKADIIGDKFTSHSFLLHLVLVFYSYPSPWQLLECCVVGNVPWFSITL